ncbi:hypothetical protein I4U23_005999 [Adineta vaga]|nr:hypothetical protein I4U23_005999 [Adineta vaga]
MSTEISHLTLSLRLAGKYIFQFGGLSLLIFGNIGCILNIMVFIQNSLRKNPCAVYLIATNIFDFFFINSLLLSIIFEAASIDRVLVTSSNVRIRQRSNLRFSYICIISGTIFWLLFHSPAWFYTTITQTDENNFISFYQIGPYLIFISFYSIVKESSSILLLIGLGLWAIKNIRRLHRVTIPTVSLQSGISRINTTYKINSKDQQFVKMVLIDIIIFSICSAVPAMFLTH